MESVCVFVRVSSLRTTICTQSHHDSGSNWGWKKWNRKPQRAARAHPMSIRRFYRQRASAKAVSSQWVAGVTSTWTGLRGVQLRGIYLRSVLSETSPECDNHSLKMESAARQTNCISTHGAAEQSMDTDVRMYRFR